MPGFSNEIEYVDAPVQAAGNAFADSALREVQKTAMIAPTSAERTREPESLDMSGLDSLYGKKQFSLSEEKLRFERLAQKSPDGESLRDNFAALETRLTGRADARQQMADVLHSVNDLLTASGTALLQPPQKQAEVASNILLHAAHPESVNQGLFNSCSFASMETEIYDRFPSTAAKMVASLAQEGSFVTADGKTVKLDPATINRPAELGDNLKQDFDAGRRDQASQIFQSAAFEALLSRSGSASHFYVGDPTTASPTGEVVADKPGGENRVFKSLPSLAQYEPLFKSLTGRDSNGLVMVSTGSNGDEFAQRLARIKSEGRLPITASISTTSELFEDSVNHETARNVIASGIDAHAISIVDYDPNSETVKFRNHIDSGEIQEMSAKEFYSNMTYGELDEKEMQTYVETLKSKVAGKPIDWLGMSVAIQLMHPNQRKEISERLGAALGEDFSKHLSRYRRQELGIAEE